MGLLLVASGGMIYVLFRSRQLLLLKIADITPLSHFITDLREKAHVLHPAEWVVYNLPGALWSGAYILIIHSLMHELPMRSRWRWCSVIPFIGAFSELGQAIGLVPGTFDLMDLACYVLPLVIYTVIVEHYHSNL